MDSIPQANDKLLYTTQDLVIMLSMCKRIILEAIKKGELQCIKYGNKFYFTKEYILNFVEYLKGGVDETNNSRIS